MLPIGPFYAGGQSGGSPLAGDVRAGGNIPDWAVHQVQDAPTISPLSSWGQEPPAITARVDPSVDMTTPPLDQVNAMRGLDFFRYAAELMKVHPPHPTDWSTLARLRWIGLTPGESFNTADLEPQVAQLLDKVPADALATLHSRLPGLASVVNGWQSNLNTVGVYGDFYVKRAIVAMVGLGANQPEDAIYPLLLTDADGKPLDGSGRYVVHFDAESLPPVDAFWSVTMYDADGFQVANPISRFAIGDRDPLRFNPDGSLDLHLQHDHPGRDKEANWLPAPEGPLGVTMRLYSPRLAVLDGSWAPPPVRRVFWP